MNSDDSKKRLRSVPRTTLLGLLSLGIYVCLFMLPATAWLMAQQIRALFEPPRALSALLYDVGAITPQAQPASPAAVQRLRDVVLHQPDDYAIQLAAALEPGYPASIRSFRVDPLRALISHFPSHPALYAHVLRYATLNEIGFRRAEEDLLTGDAVSKSAPSFHAPTPTPPQLAAFDQEAATGERLDPTNAYFPLMRAIGLITSHRDAEALAAIQRASMKPHWDDYIADEVHSRWRFHTD